MTVPVIAFFNNKGGVGKTSLVYHLSWMYHDLGHRILAADLDPQANLTAVFLEEERLEQLWSSPEHRGTIWDAIDPLLKGVGDVAEPHVEPVAEGLGLLVGNLRMARFEDELSQQWPNCLDGKERAFRVISSYWRLIQMAAERQRAEVALVDVGPNLGAINRAALVASDHVAVPLAPDLFSLQGLENLGPTLERWRKEWAERQTKNPEATLELPRGRMEPIGYIVLQHAIRLDRPVRAYDRWVAKIPMTYAASVLGKDRASKTVEKDENCLGLLKHYRSLMPMAQEARKPIFHLKPADGALGAHGTAVRNARADFERLAEEVETRTWRPHRRPRSNRRID
jgi:cellulose biosynthesis protein BcsQ